jgi:hypothetical protein
LDALCDVDSDAGDVVSVTFNLAGAQPDAHLDAERSKLIAHRGPVANAASRSVEGGEEPVAGCIDFATSESCNLCSYEMVVDGEKLTPSAITSLRE